MSMKTLNVSSFCGILSKLNCKQTSYGKMYDLVELWDGENKADKDV